MPLQISLTTAREVDAAVVRLIKASYDQNT
jgi:hypothetical protein